MAYKPTDKEKRYQKRRVDGFVAAGPNVPGEAQMLSRFRDEDLPYLQDMIKDRRRRVSLALKKGWTKEQFYEGLRGWYLRHGWFKVENGKPKRKADGTIWWNPYAMLEWYRDRYKQKNPEYQGLWRKRERDIGKLERKLKKTLAY